MSERAAWIRRHGMAGPEYRQGYFVVMTGKAGVGAFPTVRNISDRFACGLRHACRWKKSINQKQDDNSTG
jgi:hypothetical protein